MQNNTLSVPLKENGIVNTIGRYMPVKLVGNRGFCQCPFCKNQGKNFIISEKADKYKCFSCGDTGDKIDFVSKFKHLTREKAMQELGIEVKLEQNKEALKERIYELNNEAGKYFNTLLKNNSTASKYFFDRGLTKNAVNSFGLGFSGTQKDDLTKYLMRKGFKEEELLESGLSGKSTKYGKIYDKFINRVMFPIFDTENRLVGFGGRVLDDSKPKYLNSQASVVFDKSHVLYGYNKAIKSSYDSFIICEGYMDVIALHKSGYTNAVASLGTAFNQEHAEMLKRYKDKAYVCFDNDEAGLNAKLGALDKLKFSGIEIKVMDLTPYKDPDEFIKALGKKKFDERIDHAIDSYHFEIGVLRKKFDDKDVFKHEVAKLMLAATDIELEQYKTAYCDIIANGTEDFKNEFKDVIEDEYHDEIEEDNYIHPNDGIYQNATSDNRIDFLEYEIEIGE